MIASPFKKRVPLERDVQEAIVAALKAAGFVVRHTSAPKQKGESGVSKGIADLLVKHPACPLEVSLELEVKRPGPVRWSSWEQREAAGRGYFVVAQSPEEALRHARAFVHRFGEDLPREHALERADRVLAGLAEGPKVGR